MIKDILIRNGISVSIGASGSGKTTWDLQTFEAAAAGKPAFDLFPCAPLEPVFYVALDRTEEELEAKFKNINIPKDLFRYKSYQSQLDVGQPKSLIQTIFKDRPSDTKIIVLDGIGYLVEQVISQFHVGRFIAFIQRLRGDSGLTLKLIHHTPKVKGSEGYGDPREKGMGSGAWCQMARSAVVFEKLNASEVDNPYRRVWVLRSDAKDREYAFKLDAGRLTYLPFGFPTDELQKSWSLNEIMQRFGCSYHEARKIKADILSGNPVAS